MPELILMKGIYISFTIEQAREFSLLENKDLKFLTHTRALDKQSETVVLNGEFNYTKKIFFCNELVRD